MEFINGDPEKDFLTQNPELKLIPFVKNLIKGKKDTNAILWSLYLVEDPKSKFYTALSKEERIDIVQKTYNVNYEEDCGYLVQDYAKMTMSINERNYKFLNDKLQAMLLEIGGADLEDATDFFGKLPNITKGMDVFEAKYKKEIEDREEVSKNLAKGERQSGLFTQMQNN